MFICAETIPEKWFKIFPANGISQKYILPVKIIFLNLLPTKWFFRKKIGVLSEVIPVNWFFHTKFQLIDFFNHISSQWICSEIFPGNLFCKTIFSPLNFTKVSISSQNYFLTQCSSQKTFTEILPGQMIYSNVMRFQ